MVHRKTGLSWLELMGDDHPRWASCGISCKAHYDAIWRLSWSHSQRGDLLVSCSEDRQVIVWTEQGFAWKKCFQKTLGAPVLDVRFASPALGIKFAAITAESQVSVFECTTHTTLQCWESQDVMIQGKGKPGAVDWQQP
ncbi:unnamed protein product [Cladocopium goreaui]|uniref:Uncharacterized protein n=1 Tax=Cladocopium goreaui TaxID=2562237 RepID=A0A9P1D0J8_9DINO|nr:unnamed protein product [Cladocopium goreaui]